MGKKIRFIYYSPLESFLQEKISDITARNRIIQQFYSILSGTSQSLIKKVAGKKFFYTLRVGGAERFVFDSVKVDGKDYFVLRDIVWSHDYRKSLGWDPLGELGKSDFKDKYGEHTISDEQEFSEEICEKPLKNFIYYRNSWLEPTSTQTNIMGDAKFPALWVGPPGSGKTLLAMALLQERALAHQENENTEPLKLLYVTDNPFLVRELQKSWDEFKASSLKGVNTEVSFLTTSDYMEGCAKISQKELRLEYKKFSELPQERRDEFLQNAVYLWSDCDEKNAFDNSGYKNSGVKNSLITDSNKKQVFYSRALGILTEIKDKKLFVPGISIVKEFPEEEQQDLIIVDEAQNVDLATLMSLAAQAKDGNICFLGDNLQRGRERLSVFAVLGACLKKNMNLKLQESHLTETLRLQADVAEAANQLVLLSGMLRAGRLDHSYSEIISRPSEKKQHIHVLEHLQKNSCGPDQTSAEKNPAEKEKQEKQKQMLKNLGLNAQAAIIVLNKEDRMAAETLVESKAVFSARRARGLEFSQILLYISEKTLLEEFASVNQLMQEKGIHPDTPLQVRHNQPAKKEEKDGLGLQLLSDLLIAISRTYGFLYIYIEEPKDIHKIKYFLSWFKKTLGEAVADVKIERKNDTKEDWLIAIHGYIRNSNFSQAIAQLNQHFGLKEDDAKKYIEAYGKDLSLGEVSVDTFNTWVNNNCKQKEKERMPEVGEISANASNTNLQNSILSEEKQLLPQGSQQKRSGPKKTAVLEASEPPYKKLLDSMLSESFEVKRLFVTLGLIILTIYGDLGKADEKKENENKNEKKLEEFLKKNPGFEKELEGFLKKKPDFEKDILQYCVFGWISKIKNPISLLSRLFNSDEKIKEKFVTLNSYIKNAKVNDASSSLVDGLIRGSVEDADKILNLFVDAGVNLNGVFNQLGYRISHQAAMHGSREILELLWGKRVDFRAFSRSDKLTPAHMAAYTQKIESLNFLSDKGIDLDVPDSKNQTPALLAAEYYYVRELSFLSEKIEGLWDKDADLFFQHAVYAAQADQLEMLQFLLEKNPDFLNKKNKDGATLAHIAAECGSINSFKFLLERGVNLCELDNSGYTPAHVAAKFTPDHQKEVQLKKVEILRLILEKVTFTALNKKSSCTIACVAASSGGIDVLDFLWKRLIDLDEAGQDGCTPAHAAAIADQVQVLDFLKGKANFTVTNKDGLTPYEVAESYRMQGSFNFFKKLKSDEINRLELCLVSNDIPEFSAILEELNYTYLNTAHSEWLCTLARLMTANRLIIKPLLKSIIEKIINQPFELFERARLELRSANRKNSIEIMPVLQSMLSAEKYFSRDGRVGEEPSVDSLIEVFGSKEYLENLDEVAKRLLGDEISTTEKFLQKGADFFMLARMMTAIELMVQSPLTRDAGSEELVDLRLKIFEKVNTCEVTMTQDFEKISVFLARKDIIHKAEVLQKIHNILCDRSSGSSIFFEKSTSFSRRDRVTELSDFTRGLVSGVKETMGAKNAP